MSRTRDAEFDEFALSAWPRLRWSAYLLCGDYHLAEDLAQTALARTYSRWSSVRREDAVSYAQRVLVNLNIDRMRRRRPSEVGGLTSDRASRGAGPQELNEQRDEVLRLLGQLTTRERQVVVLRHYFDLSEADAAHELGISVGTIKSALARALTKLRTSENEATPATPVGLSKGIE